MTPAALELVFIALAALSSAVVWRLADPNSALSRLVDGNRRKQ